MPTKVPIRLILLALTYHVSNVQLANLNKNFRRKWGRVLFPVPFTRGRVFPMGNPSCSASIDSRKTLMPVRIIQVGPTTFTGDVGGGWGLEVVGPAVSCGLQRLHVT